MSAGTVTIWTPRPNSDGEGRIRDDGLGDDPLVYVYQDQVAGNSDLAVGQRVSYDLVLDPGSNLYMARNVR